MRLSFRWRRDAAQENVAARLHRRPAPMAAALRDHPPDEFARLIFLGDLSACGRGRAPVIDPAVVGALQTADLVIANCASPVVRRPHVPVRSWLRQRRHMDAGALLGLISAMGIETERLALSVANSRILDQSVAGFEETVDTLSALHVMVVGTASRGPVQLIRIGSLDVGLVAFTGPGHNARRFRRQVVTADDLPEVDGLVEGAKPHILCAFAHWDREQAHRPGLRTQDHAARLATCGVSLVAGHRQLRIQPIERVAHAHIAYGLGVFHGPHRGKGIDERIGAMLVADVCTAPGERGRVAAYELFPFVRLQESNRDRIVPLASAPRAVRAQAQAALGPLVATGR